MSYAILTIAEHKAELSRMDKADNEREQDLTLSVEAMDSGLSNWGSDSMRRFHGRAIHMLEKGLELTGKEVPFSSFIVLKDEHNNILSVKKIHNERFNNYSWQIDEAAVIQRLGRKYVPALAHSKKKSNIQTKLKLHEEKMDCRALRNLDSSCAHVGAPVGFKSKIDISYLTEK